MNYFIMVQNSLKKNIGKQMMIITNYIISSTLYFLYSTLIYRGGSKAVTDTNLLSIILRSSLTAIILILSFFIVYSYTSYIRRRSKEFKIMMLIGMTKKELIIYLLLENLFLIIVCMVAGIILGIIFSKFFFILIINYIGVPGLSFSLSNVNCIYTLYFFIIIYCVIAFRTRKLIKNINSAREIKYTHWMKNIRKAIKSILPLFYIAIAVYLRRKDNRDNYVFIWILCMLVLYVLVFYISKLIVLIMKRKDTFYRKNLLLIKQFIRNMDEDNTFIFTLAYLGFLFITYNMVCEASVFKQYSGHIGFWEFKIFRFISIFTNIVFFSISSSIVYFKCQMELESTSEYMKKLYNIGITREECWRLIKYRLVSVFFTPCTLYIIISIILMIALKVHIGNTIFTEIFIIIISLIFNIVGYSKAKKLYEGIDAS